MRSALSPVKLLAARIRAARGAFARTGPRLTAGGIAAHLALALAFLFAQQTASLHWLSHAIEATHAKANSGGAPADHCDECLALSALGAAAASSALHLPVATGQHALFAAAPAVPSPAGLRLAFRSRAPPIPS